MSNKKNYHDYNIRLKGFARKLRNNSTKAEIQIWSQLLRARKMKGYSFLRLRPTLQYIGDFYCKDLKLVLEIDDWTHEDEEVQKKDKVRQKALEAADYNVLRFTDHEVFHHLEAVKERLEQWIENFETDLPPCSLYKRPNLELHFGGGKSKS